jgi:hypothetical protein
MTATPVTSIRSGGSSSSSVVRSMKTRRSRRRSVGGVDRRRWGGEDAATGERASASALESVPTPRRPRQHGALVTRPHPVPRPELGTMPNLGEEHPARGSKRGGPLTRPAVAPAGVYRTSQEAVRSPRRLGKPCAEAAMARPEPGSRRPAVDSEPVPNARSERSRRSMQPPTRCSGCTQSGDCRRGRP